MLKNSNGYNPATDNRAGRYKTLEEELYEHITLGHLDPFWVDRTGIARFDLDKWKKNKLPIDGISGIVETIYGHLEEPDFITSRRITSSSVVIAIDEYRSYLVKNLFILKKNFQV